MTLLLQRTKTPGPQLCVCFAVSPKVKVFRSPSGTFCPKARGLSPQHMWEQAPCVFAARPCFSCPQRMHCMLNATPNQKANRVPTNPWYSAACLLQLYIVLSVSCRNCASILSKISEAALQIQARKRACTHSSICAEKYKPSLGRGHGKSEPRSVGVLENAHGMTLLLQRTKTPGPQLCVCFAVSPKVKVFRSPSGTFCPKARGLSPQHMWEQAPCVFAARPCFSCPQC